MKSGNRKKRWVSFDVKLSDGEERSMAFEWRRREGNLTVLV
jgi:hypothetical protein